MKPSKFAFTIPLIFLILFITAGCQKQVECTQFTGDDAAWAKDQLSGML